MRLLAIITLSLILAGCFVASKTQPGQVTHVQVASATQPVVTVAASMPAVTTIVNFPPVTMAAGCLGIGLVALGVIVWLALCDHANRTDRLAIRREMLK